MNIKNRLKIWFRKRKFIINALNRDINRDFFKQKLSFKIIFGLSLIILGLICSWPIIPLMTSISIYFGVVDYAIIGTIVWLMGYVFTWLGIIIIGKDNYLALKELSTRLIHKFYKDDPIIIERKNQNYFNDTSASNEMEQE